MESTPPLLVVDADDGSRTSLAALLRECGYPVLEARNGVEGLQVSRGHAPALVIVDPWPFVSAAAQMVERIQDDRPGTEVLMLTSEPFRVRRSRSRFEGIARCLDKPCSADELLAEVVRLVARGGRAGEGTRLAPGVRA